MAEAKPLKKGDPCPNCGGELRAAPTMSADQHARAYDRENPQSMPSHYDTAHPDTRAEIGDLYRCSSCGYQARFKGDKGAAASRADTTRGGRGRDEQRDGRDRDQGNGRMGPRNAPRDDDRDDGREAES